jgi:hypothetical protein
VTVTGGDPEPRTVGLHTTAHLLTLGLDDESIATFLAVEFGLTPRQAAGTIAAARRQLAARAGFARSGGPRAG